MKLSLNWLRSNDYWSKTQEAQLALMAQALDLNCLVKQLPLIGFELDGVDAVGEDTVLDIAITANRGDCFSVRGMVREIACAHQLPFHDWILDAQALPWQKPTQSFVAIDASAACPIYAGGVISGIPQNVSAPAWMIDRLQKSGIESIHPIVDILNYVMLEVGQPLHAFDTATLSGSLTVRLAQPGEVFTGLGEQKITLVNNTLVIADALGPQALAGILGGLSSGVSQATTEIFLESAYFTPQAIAGRARQYGLQTEAAQRFERGVDPALPLLALNYAAQLILTYIGGTLGALHSAHGVELPAPAVIMLRSERIQRILGVPITAADVFKVLPPLGMKVEKIGRSEYEIIPPSFRFDVSLEVDLIEEIARVSGYHHIPINPPCIYAVAERPALTPEQKPALVLVQRGYREIISYSFINESLHNICFPAQPAVRLSNPLSAELAVMRSSLWPSLIATWQYNMNRQQTRARFFETGRTYHSAWDAQLNSVAQELVLSGLVSGDLDPDQWGVKPKSVDFYDIKADVEAIFQARGTAKKIQFVAADVPMLQAGQAAKIFLDDICVGQMGRLHPALQQHFALPNPVYLFEINIERLPKPVAPRYQDISRFPAVRRDFAFLVPRDQAVGAILQFVQAQLNTLCTEVILFDVYEGDKIAQDQKSIAFRIVLQDVQATLADSMVNELCAELVQTLTRKFSAQQR